MWYLAIMCFSRECNKCTISQRYNNMDSWDNSTPLSQPPSEIWGVNFLFRGWNSHLRGGIKIYGVELCVEAVNFLILGGEVGFVWVKFADSTPTSASADPGLRCHRFQMARRLRGGALPSRTPCPR